MNKYMTKSFGGFDMYLDLTVEQASSLIKNKLSHFFGVNNKDASNEELYKATAMTVRDLLSKNRAETRNDDKKVYYLCMEFLLGRSLKNNIYNLNLEEVFSEALESNFGVKLSRLYEMEPDAGLGNGGLGRLAACYMDALASGGYNAVGYSIRYEYGIFSQKLIDGWQTESPDFWLPGGEVWMLPHEEDLMEVRFEGEIKDWWDGSYHHLKHENYKPIYALPYDMMISGKDGKGVSILRLWASKAPGLDMSLFNQGDYMRAVEQQSMAEVISKVLYPSDNHEEGKSLRLRQQYFLVSASMQDIIKTHLAKYGSLDNFADKVALHINDTHPTLVIPELMRILMDDCGYNWDGAWAIVKGTVAYTNHTVMREALECWPEDLFKRLLPRIWQIVKEIDNRFREEVWNSFYESDRVERMAIVSNGVIRMANMCVAASHSINGVSALHSDILKKSVFSDFYAMYPYKFKNVTNGIAHRRWLCQSNPRLSKFISSLIGDGFVNDGSELIKLRDFVEDKSVLNSINKIKLENKIDFSNYIEKKMKIKVDPTSIFDVQVKRLHEYKRQQMNALHIISLYQYLKDNPNADIPPRTFIFGAKAAPGYYMAKKIINLICALADMINNDPEIHDLIKVIYLEDYRVTLAEMLMPASDVSEQISLAGTEASGTGNMKLMLNGAITIGTMDGANVEIYEAVGPDNIIIFGMNTQEVNELRMTGYHPYNYYLNNQEIHRAIEVINQGINGKSFSEIGNSFMNHDPYMALADYADYRSSHQRLEELWTDRELWAKMSLMNISGAGRFAADRAIQEYAKNIWHL